MKTLGICIPTYRRPEFLRRCVLSAFESAGDRKINVFIADDSMDETNQTLYAELQMQFDSLIICHNIANLGIDDNIQNAVNICDCDYAWLVGEDDYFLPGAVKRVYDLLQVDSPIFVLVNYVYGGDKSEILLGQALEAVPSRMDATDFIAHNLWAAGFIGACIVDRRRWERTSTIPYKNTYYTHVGRICELLSTCSEPLTVVAEPCVVNRVEGIDTFTWKHDSYGVFFGFCAMCRAVAKHCPAFRNAAATAIQVMTNRYGWLSIRLAMRLRSELGYDHAQYRRYLRPHISNPLRRLVFFLISITHPAIFRPLVAVYRRTRRNVR